MTSPAPAAMPSEEEIARVIWGSALLQPARGEWRGDNSATEQCCLKAARDILALFAPILAEKERRALNTEWHKKCATVQCERAEHAEARALAAESALAAARAEYQALRAAYDASLEIWSQHAAIRAKGE